MRILSILALAACHVLGACSREPASRGQLAEEANPIVGAWELIHGEYGDGAGGVQVRSPGMPFQLKLFTPTHFAYSMQADDGSFSGASAGAYTLGDGTYTETHTYNSNPTFAGAVATWTYRVSGDTLVMEGPTEAFDASGAPLMETVPRMREIRIRAW
jgi:hypothetical protein